MPEIDISSVFDLLGYVVRSSKPPPGEPMLTVADLEARVQELRASGRSKGEPTEVPVSKPSTEGKATSIASGCVPCSINHLATCSGLLNEAMRFARSDGIQSEEVISRVNMCLDELNTLERVDLRPEMIVDLPNWEKSLAVKALDLSRSLRHDLEGLSSIDGLERIAAKTQGTRQQIGSAWFRERLSRMSPEQRQVVEDKLKQKFTLGEAKKVAAAEAAKEVEERWNSQEKK